MTSLSSSDVVTIGGGLAYSVQNITGPGAISLTTPVTLITTSGDSENDYTLADGTEGQLKIIIMKVKDGQNARIEPSNLVGYTAVRLNNVHDNFQLLYGSTGWNIIALQNATKIS